AKAAAGRWTGRRPAEIRWAAALQPGRPPRRTPPAKPRAPPRASVTISSSLPSWPQCHASPGCDVRRIRCRRPQTVHGSGGKVLLAMARGGVRLLGQRRARSSAEPSTIVPPGTPGETVHGDDRSEACCHARVPERTVETERRGQRVLDAKELQRGVLLLAGVGIEDVVAADGHREGVVELVAGLQIEQRLAAVVVDVVRRVVAAEQADRGAPAAVIVDP